MTIAREILDFTDNNLESRADAFKTINELWCYGSDRYLPGRQKVYHMSRVIFEHSLRFKDNSLLVAVVDDGKIKQVYSN